MAYFHQAIVLVVAACAPAIAAEPRPLVVAHRGLLHHPPENTLANFRACLELRLDAGSGFDPKFAGEKVPTVEEVLKLVSEYRQHDILVAVDLKAQNVAQEVVRLRLGKESRSKFYNIKG